MKKNTLINISDDWYAMFFMIIIYFSGWLSIPTIASIDGFQPKNDFIKWLFYLYSEHNQLYILISGILLMVIDYLMYYIIKYICKKSYENAYSRKTIQNEYSQFLEDASFVYIFGGKLSFIEQSDSQFEKIKSLGSKCKIVCEDIKNNSTKNKDKCDELIKNNVQIRVYSGNIDNDIINFRGQIKINENGIKESLLVTKEIDSRQKEIFKKITLSNQYLNQMLLDNFNNIFNDGKNPMITCIVLDLGGVYFDGDLENDFIKPVNHRLSQNIQIERQQSLILNERLNLGDIDIVKYIEIKIHRNLNKDEKEFVYTKWKRVWKPNENMISLVEKLKKNGYKMSIISNLDKENGNMYRSRGDFYIFDNDLFLSYECGLLKPDRAFFSKICDTYNIKPYEILIIDDHEININTARELGMNTIRFCIQEDPTAESLYKELEAMNIKVNNPYRKV